MAMWGGGFGAGSQAVNPQNIAVAEQELEMVTDLFNRISNVCYNKCIPPKYAEDTLNKGESVCIDRCVAKFMDVNLKISELLQKRGQEGGGGVPGVPAATS
ncbi:Tim10/DDP family zinc finger-domain-containing protein [Jimgerdemannia flammicorona]|uniref:Mitochondrial import inner membrane translocase subunit n=2 Tax=Jimgerdemannia flammicorona TaxID=994334 RepID=A0A433D4S8_9FUNG|nr:Tim10/DDP family zinc finger-domain-containing protein [Jimgerdemannia flammicorona]RUS18651.1 Tim10/DDP family zinc finger-domain-containing protein [Jimgerdemannia flammicorona]